MGKRQPYIKRETIHKTIPEHRILKTENNIQNIEENIKIILEHIIKLLQGYLPIEREFKNGSSARHSAVQYMVMALFDG
jgi:hypothetical protein